MFTGIIQTLGTVAELKPTSKETYELTLKANFPDIKESPVVLGESIAVNGVCLTVTSIQNQSTFTFDLAPETVVRTSFSQLSAKRKVNLERSLKIGDRMSGHWVQGHVDGTATLVGSVVLPAGNTEITIQIPSAELLRYCVKKGSIAIDGISLTIHDIQQNQLKFQIIPHTWKETNLSDLSLGEKLNIEVDILAKYIERLKS